MDYLETIQEAVRSIENPKKYPAKTYNLFLRSRLMAHGWIVLTEVVVPDRGDGRRGRVDLVVEYPTPIAIEVDADSVRRKSLIKMACLKGYKQVSILRRTGEIIEHGRDTFKGWY